MERSTERENLKWSLIRSETYPATLFSLLFSFPPTVSRAPVDLTNREQFFASDRANRAVNRRAAVSRSSRSQKRYLDYLPLYRGKKQRTRRLAVYINVF